MSPEKLLTLSSDRRRLIPYLLGVLGVVLMVAGIAINYFQSTQKTSGSGKTEMTPETSLREIKPRTIKVDVSGAVEKPGVYELPEDSRVKDVLITAGGLVAKADRNYLSKSVNLAQRLTDGMKVYFPFEGETVIGVNSASGLGIKTGVNYQININTATTQELDDLPGIGPVTANKIIAGRPYQNISELITRKIVTNSVYQKIKDRLTVY